MFSVEQGEHQNCLTTTSFKDLFGAQKTKVLILRNTYLLMKQPLEVLKCHYITFDNQENGLKLFAALRKFGLKSMSGEEFLLTDRRLLL